MMLGNNEQSEWLRRPVALEMMRGANFPASLALYFVWGLLWLYQGSLGEFARDVTLTFSSTARR